MIAQNIKFSVPPETDALLEKDARLFEVFKPDNRTINKNDFITRLLCGYYDTYNAENTKTYNAICKALAVLELPEKKIHEAATAVQLSVYQPGRERKKNKIKMTRISYKVTAESEPIVDDIDRNLRGMLGVSEFVSRMVISYSKKPINERERIIFKENYDALKRACEAKYSVKVSLIWPDSKQYEVMPYAMALGSDEMFNYLVCEEITDGVPKVKSLRLNRIATVRHGSRTTPISDPILERCKRTVETAAQYAINSDDEICVKLSDRGERLYNRIYHSRPKYERIDDREDGHYYYFRCSEPQALHYFRKFDEGTAEILQPEDLRNSMIKFHEGALTLYKANEEENAGDEYRKI